VLTERVVVRDVHGEHNGHTHAPGSSVLAAATRRTTRLGLVSRSAVQRHTPSCARMCVATMDSHGHASSGLRGPVLLDISRTPSTTASRRSPFPGGRSVRRGRMLRGDRVLAFTPYRVVLAQLSVPACARAEARARPATFAAGDLRTRPLSSELSFTRSCPDSPARSSLRLVTLK